MKKIYKDVKERDHWTKRVWKHGSKKNIKRIYERDHSRCTHCGISEEQHKEETNRTLVIHHVDCNSKHNTVENQKLLCVKCHNKLHGVLRKTKFDAGYKITLHREIFMRCAHNLRDGYPHACKNIHGEYFRIRVWLEGSVLDKYGMLIDFKKIKKEVEGKYDHKYLNEIPPFNKINPTAENIAQHIFIELNLKFSKLITKPTLKKVRVYESNSSYAEVSR